MIKNYLFTLLLIFYFSISFFGQGSEKFTGVTLPTGYNDGSFVGAEAISWTFVASRDANGDDNNSGIELPALMLRRNSSDSKITSSAITGGIGDFSVKLYKGFTGGGNRQVELFINGDSKGTSTPFDDFDEHVFTVAGLNITGDIIIEIRNITSKQVIIDDITWTAPSTEPAISVTSPANNVVFSGNTTDVPVDVSISNFTLSGEVGNSETSDGTGDGYIKSILQADGDTPKTKTLFSTNTFTVNVDSGKTYVLSLELVDNNGDSLSTKTEDTVTFSVKLPCELVLGEITTICDALTSGTDTYSGSIAFSGGNAGFTYTITTASGVTIGGDNPNTVASGTITFTGMTEGMDTDILIVGDETSSCNFSKTLASPICLPEPICPDVGSLIVTEIMQNPTKVDDKDGEYFEVYNTTGAVINIQGWVLKSLTTSAKNHTIVSSIDVQPNDYIVLGINSDSSANGGITVDYQYGSNFFLGNGTDSIVLECGGNIVDAVSWDNGATFPDPEGKSMELAVSKYNATDNDLGSNWGEATSEIVSGGDLGTPGAANDYVLSIIKNESNSFTTYPNPVTNNRFTITSNSTDKKTVSIYNVLGKRVLLTSFSGVENQVDVSGVSSGIYILKVTEGAKTATSKLVIK